MRTHIWKPEEIDSPEEVKDNDGNSVYEEDGITPKIKMIKKPSPFKGIIIFEICKYTERLKMMKECNIGVEKKDTDTVKMVEIALKKITKVELTRIDDGKEFKTTEELEFDKEGSAVLMQIANDVLTGVRLGENLIPD